MPQAPRRSTCLLRCAAGLMCFLLVAGCHPSTSTSAVFRDDAGASASRDLRGVLEDAVECNSLDAMNRFAVELIQGVERHLDSGAVLPWAGAGTAADQAEAERFRFPADVSVLGVRAKYFQLSDGLMPGAFVYTDDAYAGVKAMVERRFPELECELIDGAEACGSTLLLEDNSQGIEALVFMLVAPREGITETSIGCGPYARDMFR